jgi:hypothetical protein
MHGSGRIKHGFNAPAGSCKRTKGTTMLRKLLLPHSPSRRSPGCATGYSYRGGNGDYYYGQPSVEYRYYGWLRLWRPIDVARGITSVFGRPVYGYPYGYYGGRYPSYPATDMARVRVRRMVPATGGHDGIHDQSATRRSGGLLQPAAMARHRSHA